MRGARSTRLATGGLCAVLLAGFLAFPAGPAGAGTTTWQHDPATPGDWFASGNWTAGVPVASGNAHIDNGGTAMIDSLAAAANFLSLGLANSGSVTQTGGSLDLTEGLSVRGKTGASPAFDLSGGALNAAYYVAVGGEGTPQFLHSGGTLQTGSLDVGCRYVKSGTYRLSGSAVVVTSEAQVGADNGKGYFYQTGGRLEVGKYLYIGNAYSAYGEYRLSGGQLQAGALYVGVSSPALFAQSDGACTAGWFSQNDSSRLALSGGVLDIRAGGAVATGGKWDLQGTGAVLAGGIMNLGQAVIQNPGAASFTVQADSLTIFPAGFDPAASFGAFVNNGLVANYGSPVVIPAGRSVLGRGTIRGHVECDGVLRYDTGGYVPAGGSGITLESGLRVGPGGLAELGSGKLTVNNTISGMSGGGLVCGREWIGHNTTARFVQTGGTHTVNGDLMLGHGSYTRATATYEIRGGELIAREISVGHYNSTGTFIQDGGSVRITEGLLVGTSYDRPIGNYLLNDGTLSAGSILVASLDSTGQFVQTGGTAEVPGLFNIGPRGTYRVSGGALNVGQLKVGGPAGGPYECRLEIESGSASIHVSQRFSLGGRSVFAAAPGVGVHMVGAVFGNEGTDSSALGGLKNLALIFEGGAGDTDPFEVAGKDKGASWEAFHDNFTHGAVQLGGADVGMVKLVDAFDNQADGQAVKEALYVRHLVVGPGSTLDLGGLKVYCLGFSGGGSVVPGGGSITVVPPIRAVSATFVDSAYTWDGSAGLLTISDTADIVVEGGAAQTTYAGGSLEMAAALLVDESAGGIASGWFGPGTLAVRNAAAEVLLTGDLVELALREVTDGGGLLAGSGWFEVTGGILEEAFGQAWGRVVQITFQIAPSNIADFKAGFTGVTNVTLTPIPEPATLALLVAGAWMALSRRRRRLLCTPPASASRPATLAMLAFGGLGLIHPRRARRRAREGHLGRIAARLSLMLIAVVGLAAGTDASVILSGQDAPLPVPGRPDLEGFKLVLTAQCPGEVIWGWDIRVSGPALNQLSAKVNSAPTLSLSCPTTPYRDQLPLGGTIDRELADTHFLYPATGWGFSFPQLDGAPMEDNPPMPNPVWPDGTVGSPGSYAEGPGTFLYDVFGLVAGDRPNVDLAWVVIPKGTGASYAISGLVISAAGDGPQIDTRINTSLVPEPAALTLLAVGGLGLIRRRGGRGKV